MAISLYLQNKEGKNIFKNILNYFNEVINIASNIIPILLISFLFTDILIRNDNIINTLSNLYSMFFEKLKMPYYDYISKSITLGFFNQIYSIEALNNAITFVSRLIIAIIIITTIPAIRAIISFNIYITTFLFYYTLTIVSYHFKTIYSTSLPEINLFDVNCKACS